MSKFGSHENLNDGESDTAEDKLFVAERANGSALGAGRGQRGIELMWSMR
jgi:hypothetical protein